MDDGNLSLYFHETVQVTSPGCGSSSGQLEVLIDLVNSRHYIRQLPSWVEVFDVDRHLQFSHLCSRCLVWQEASSPLSQEPLLPPSLKLSTFSQSGSGRKEERSVGQSSKLLPH